MVLQLTCSYSDTKGFKKTLTSQGFMARMNHGFMIFTMKMGVPVQEHLQLSPAPAAGSSAVLTAATPQLSGCVFSPSVPSVPGYWCVQWDQTRSVQNSCSRLKQGSWRKGERQQTWIRQFRVHIGRLVSTGSQNIPWDSTNKVEGERRERNPSAGGRRECGGLEASLVTASRTGRIN